MILVAESFRPEARVFLEMICSPVQLWGEGNDAHQSFTSPSESNQNISEIVRNCHNISMISHILYQKW